MSDLARDLIERAVLTERAVTESASSASGGQARVVGAARSVSPADVAATVEGVSVGGRPHMRADRPAVECKRRVGFGRVCPDCGAVG